MPSKPESPISTAQKLFREGNYAEALPIVNSILIEDSANFLAHELRVEILIHFHDTIEATTEFNLAWDIAESAERRKELLARMVNREDLEGNHEKAKKMLLEELTLYDTISESKRRNIEEVTDKLLIWKDTSEAIKVYEKALRADPNWADGHKSLGEIYSHKGNTRKSIEHYKEAIKKTGNASIEYNIAIGYMALKDKISAKKYFKSASDKGHKQACENYREMTAITRYNRYSRCCDGSQSYHTGRGTCSHHGGVCSIEFSPYKEYTVNCK